MMAPVSDIGGKSKYNAKLQADVYECMRSGAIQGCTSTHPNNGVPDMTQQKRAEFSH